MNNYGLQQILDALPGACVVLFVLFSLGCCLGLRKDETAPEVWSQSGNGGGWEEEPDPSDLDPACRRGRCW